MKQGIIPIIAFAAMVSAVTTKAGDVEVRPEFRLWLSHNSSYLNKVTGIPADVRTISDNGKSYILDDDMEGGGSFRTLGGSAGLNIRVKRIEFGGGVINPVRLGTSSSFRSSADTDLNVVYANARESTGLGWYAELGLNFSDDEGALTLMAGYSQSPYALSLEKSVAVYRYFSEPKYDKCSYIGWWHCPAYYGEVDHEAKLSETRLADGRLRRFYIGIRGLPTNNGRRGHFGSMFWFSWTLNPFSNGYQSAFPGLKLERRGGHLGLNVLAVFSP